jgi:hypothetical protein
MIATISASFGGAKSSSCSMSIDVSIGGLAACDRRAPRQRIAALNLGTIGSQRPGELDG